MNIIIRLNFSSSEIASHVLQSILPDNSPLPSGLAIHCVKNGSTVTILIESIRSIESTIATIEDILSSVNLVIRTKQSLATADQASK